MDNLFRFFTDPELQQKHPFLFYAWALLLHIAGAVYWANFFDWGNKASFLFHDWMDITIPRLAFVQNALRQGMLPLHTADTQALHGITNRFLTFPDLLLSPQVLLLAWMDLYSFFVANCILTFLAGGIGLVWVARKLKLSILSFSLLFLLFNFNGHILGHLSVGHYTWTAYFLFPWLMGLALTLFENAVVGWKWVSAVAGLLFMMFLQGGYHHYVWSLFFLGLLTLVLPHHFKRILQAGIFSVLICAVRLLPLFLSVGDYSNTYLNGYASTFEIWNALINQYLPNQMLLTADLNTQVGAWEYSLYVGLVGAGFLIGCGMIAVIRNRSVQGSYFRLLVPVVSLTVLSLDLVYKYLRILLPLPIFTGERVATRLAVIAFILVMMLAVVEFQRYLNNQAYRSTFTLIGIGLLFILANDLWQNARFWQIDYAILKFPPPDLQPQVGVVLNIADPVYFNVLWAGLAVTLLTAAFLGWKVYHQKQER